MKIITALFLAMAAFCLPARAAGPGDLAAFLAQARAAGENAPDIAKLALVEATSRRMLRVDGDVDFPFSVGIDLPLDAQPQSLSSVLTGPVEETGRFAVIFEVALAKVSRKVRDMKDRQSRKVVSVNKIDNPAFTRAVKELDSASTRLERAPGNAKLAQRYEAAQTKMSTTPRYLEQPVLGPYAFRLADIEGRKALTVNYFVIDRVTNRYVKAVLDVVENERFTLAYDVDASDPGISALAGEVSTERQLRDWERAPVVVPLSQILEHAASAGGPAQAMGSAKDLLAQLARDRSATAARVDRETYDDRPLNDPRFDSVVVIYTPQGMGSGFFVRSNIVMTNWHVVEKRPIVELRLYDKRESFGQVIAKDVRLDLALVKVQDRGRPVEFLQGKDIAPGDTLDAIGHPKRQLFTITRGIASSVRKMRLNEAGKGGEPVLYIQTDADINPGNSGGPLFKGNKVVGVNTFALQTNTSDDNVAAAAPGLNFAVHYSEARRFLEESLKGE